MGIAAHFLVSISGDIQESRHKLQKVKNCPTFREKWMTVPLLLHHFLSQIRSKRHIKMGNPRLWSPSASPLPYFLLSFPLAQCIPPSLLCFLPQDMLSSQSSQNSFSFTMKRCTVPHFVSGSLDTAQYRHSYKNTSIRKYFASMMITVYLTALYIVQ